MDTPSADPFTQRALADPDAFWAEQARRIHWEEPYRQVCDFSQAPFVRWFVGGRTNLCYNAVDRHLATRGEQPAIFFISSETGEERTLTYRELHREVTRMAAVLLALGLGRGDRVIIYLPMIPEAAIAMLACVRLGIIHSVVFAGFAAPSLATRIDDAGAKLVITADAGLRAGKLVSLKRLTDEALSLASTTISQVLVVDRGLDPSAPKVPGRDVDYASFSATIGSNDVPCVWLESSEPSYLLYTSGTTARPKGVQHETGGRAVALAASMQHIFGGQPGETFFSAADLGWAVGHSYGVYGPLLQGMATVIYEGVPIRPDGAIWWKIAEQTQATVMFVSPTGLRVLKKQDPALLRRHDLSRLRSLFIAGEPLDEPTSVWIRDALQHVQIIDNYWQTESGWPILTLMPGLGPVQVKPGSPGFPAYGYRVQVVDPATGDPLPRGEKGVLVLGLPLPPGCMSTVWKHDEVFARHYCSQFPGKPYYATFDYAVQDKEGYFYILGRTDDVINVAGHRLGTREIEETVCSHPAVAENATIGAADDLKGQVVKCFVVLKHGDQYATAEAQAQVRREIVDTVVQSLGAIARPTFVGLVPMLPKTRSGKIIRRAILAIAEGRDPGDVGTIEDPAALDCIRDACAAALSSSNLYKTQA